MGFISNFIYIWVLCYLYLDSLLFLNDFYSLYDSEVGFIQTLFIFGFKVTQICKILSFCLGDLYFQTVDVLRGRATTDIIVIYISSITVEPRMGVRLKFF